MSIALERKALPLEFTSLLVGFVSDRGRKDASNRHDGLGILIRCKCVRRTAEIVLEYNPNESDGMISQRTLARKMSVSLETSGVLTKTLSRTSERTCRTSNRVPRQVVSRILDVISFERA